MDAVGWIYSPGNLAPSPETCIGFFDRRVPLLGVEAAIFGLVIKMGMGVGLGAETCFAVCAKASSTKQAPPSKSSASHTVFHTTTLPCPNHTVHAPGHPTQRQRQRSHLFDATRSSSYPS